jgi:hypothetical protein
MPEHPKRAFSKKIEEHAYAVALYSPMATKLVSQQAD